MINYFNRLFSFIIPVLIIFFSKRLYSTDEQFIITIIVFFSNFSYSVGFFGNQVEQLKTEKEYLFFPLAFTLILLFAFDFFYYSKAFVLNHFLSILLVFLNSFSNVFSLLSLKRKKLLISNFLWSKIWLIFLLTPIDFTLKMSLTILLALFFTYGHITNQIKTELNYIKKNQPLLKKQSLYSWISSCSNFALSNIETFLIFSIYGKEWGDVFLLFYVVKAGKSFYIANQHKFIGEFARNRKRSILSVLFKKNILQNSYISIIYCFGLSTMLILINFFILSLDSNITMSLIFTALTIVAHYSVGASGWLMVFLNQRGYKLIIDLAVLVITIIFYNLFNTILLITLMGLFISTSVSILHYYILQKTLNE